MELVRHNHDGISWIEAGSGPAAVLLHGMPGSSESWGPQFDALSRHYHVIAWDMPGYGGSPLNTEIDNPQKGATLLAKVMRGHWGLSSAHVVGLSLGGMIAMELAVADPELVTSLVLLDCSPKFGLDGGSGASEFVQSVREPLQAGTTVADLCREILKDLMASDVDPVVFETAHASMSRATPEGLVQAATMIGAHDAMARLAQINAPTLVLVGAKDTATPPSYSATIANEIPDATYSVIDGAGHLSNLERSDLTNRLLSDFLRQLSPASDTLV